MKPLSDQFPPLRCKKRTPQRRTYILTTTDLFTCQRATRETPGDPGQNRILTQHRPLSSPTFEPLGNGSGRFSWLEGAGRPGHRSGWPSSLLLTATHGHAKPWPWHPPDNPPDAKIPAHSCKNPLRRARGACPSCDLEVGLPASGGSAMADLRGAPVARAAQLQRQNGRK